jgi:hypothetical protein
MERIFNNLRAIVKTTIRKHIIEQYKMLIHLPLIIPAASIGGFRRPSKDPIHLSP